MKKLELAPAREYIKVKLYAVGRARCPQCSHRWPWPEDAPTLAESPLVRPTVACPECHHLVPLETEPCDERWWQYVSTPPSAKPAKAQICTRVQKPPSSLHQESLSFRNDISTLPATETQESERALAQRLSS